MKQTYDDPLCYTGTAVIELVFFSSIVLRRAVKQHHTESSCSYCITAYKIYNSVVRRRKIHRQRFM